MKKPMTSYCYHLEQDQLFHRSQDLNENETLFTLRNIPDTDKIKNYVDDQKPKRQL